MFIPEMGVIGDNCIMILFRKSSEKKITMEMSYIFPKRCEQSKKMRWITNLVGCDCVLAGDGRGRE